MQRDETPTALAVRREVQELLREIAGPKLPRETIKGAINRVVTSLDHPELEAGTVKRFWYAEQTVMPAHLVDYIRRRSPRRANRSFTIDRSGRVSMPPLAGAVPVITVLLDDERITVQLHVQSPGSAAASILKQWLLTMLSDPRPFRIVDVLHHRISQRRSAVEALDYLDGFGRDKSLSSDLGGEAVAMAAQAAGVSTLADLAKTLTEKTASNPRDLAALLVRTHDCIAFVPGSDLLTVFAKPSTSLACREVALSWLMSQGISKVRLRIWLSHSWIAETYSSLSEACDRLYTIFSAQSLAIPTPRYSGRRVRAEQLEEDESRLLAPILNLPHNEFDETAVTSLLRSGYADRLFLIRIRDGYGQFINYPSGFDFVGSAWRLTAPGLRIVDQPDRSYGEYVNQRFLEAAKEGTPHVEHVHALIHESDDDASLKEMRSVHYIRVAVPCHNGRDQIVISYTIPRRWNHPASIGS